MTRDEFKQWFRYHAAGSTGTYRHFLTYPSESSGVAPTRRDILEHWYSRLAAIDIDDAKDASQRMFDGEAEAPHFDAIPGVIRALALKRKRLRSVGDNASTLSRDPTYRCYRCQDTGVVPIIHPRSLKRLLAVWPDGPPDRFQYADVCAPAGVPIVYTAGRDCACQRGEKRPGPHYDEAQDCYFTGSNFDDVREWFIRDRESRRFQSWEPEGVGAI